jgi:hypothetical protein
LVGTALFTLISAYDGEYLEDALPEPAMAERVDSNLIYEILKDVQARLAGLEGMRGEMREGFASLRAHLATQYGERVKRRLELAEDS